MRGRVFGLVFSLVVVLALLASSCAPKPVEPAVKPVEPAVRPVEPIVRPVEPIVRPVEPAVKLEAPQYGGRLRLALLQGIRGFDQASGLGHTDYVINQFTNETLLMVNWAIGPSGTGEADLYPASVIVPGWETGMLAESYELPDPETFIFHIRRGVYFHNKPPVNGRELDAEDVVRTMWRTFWEFPKAYNASRFPVESKPVSMKALDKYTVEMKVFPGQAAEVLRLIADWTKVDPREVLTKAFGGINRWQDIIGTGPFIITDYVEESAATLVRNTRFWDTDPVAGPGKGNQLPYLDGVDLFVIPDISTRLAALRTGKVDQLEQLSREQVVDLLRYSPQLKTKWWISRRNAATAIAMRSDTPPFDNVKVRQALSMAIDREKIRQTLYKGEAIIMTDPAQPFEIHKQSGAYIPLEQYPRSVQELFEYHPDKAKQLLKDAGYPQGFKMEVLAWSTEQIDMLSIIKEYFAAIGVELTIDVKERAVYTAMTGKAAPTFKQAVCQGLSGHNPNRLHPYRSRDVGGVGNAIVNDPIVDKMYLEGAGAGIDRKEWDEKAKLVATLYPYLLEKAYYIQIASPYEYVAWQPWLKGYDGEMAIYWHPFVGSWARYAWIDQELKKQLME